MGHMPLVFARGPGAGARNSIGIMLVTGMIIGTAVHAVRRPVDLRPRREDARGRSKEAETEKAAPDLVEATG